MLKLKTKLMSVLLSAFGSGGLCFFLIIFFSTALEDPHLKYPLDIAASSFGALVCLILCIVITALYIGLRVKHDYKKGIVTDILVVILLFVPFFVLWLRLCAVAEEWTWLRDLFIAILE